MELTEQQKQTLMAVCLLAVLCIGGAAYYWFMFGKKTIAEQELAYAKANDGAKLWEEKMLEINKFKEESSDEKKDELKVKLSEMERRLPSTREAIAFYRALDDVLNETGIITNSLKPGKIDDSNPNFEEIPYTISAAGDFHSFGQFLSLVEDNPDRFMRVKTLQISQNLQQPEQHGISVGIGTFRFIEKQPEK